tara:strand:- start:46 stop:237 length:192 start_codon:yes stop_codon:yes gene_type:complete
MITLKLTQKEAQAILSAAETFFEDNIKKAKEKDSLAVFWRILFKDFQTGIKKAGKQYDEQVKK